MVRNMILNYSRIAKFDGFEIFKELLILDIPELKNSKAQACCLKNGPEASLSQKKKEA
jgi:hypothetical protein